MPSSVGTVMFCMISVFSIWISSRIRGLSTLPPSAALISTLTKRRASNDLPGRNLFSSSGQFCANSLDSRFQLQRDGAEHQAGTYRESSGVNT